MTTADFLRATGGILQIAGVLEIGREIAQARQSFGLPSDRARVAGAVRRRVRTLLVRAHLVKRTPVELSGTVSMEVSMTATLTVTHAPDDELPVEERLRRHRARLDDQDRRLDDLDHSVRNEASQRGAALDKAARQLRDEIAEQRELIESVTGGALRLRWYAAVAIIAGVVLTTWPAGIAGLIDRF
jgi:hypothetical protein